MIEKQKNIDNARDHVRVAWGLVENYVNSLGLDKTPREIQLAYDELEKADRELEDLDIEISKALSGGLQ